MRGLKWFKTSENLPPYDIKVLGWIACESCRKKENHSHNLAWHEWTNCDFYPCVLKDHQWESGSYERSGDTCIYTPKSPAKVMKDTWTPYPCPSYWAYINPPDFEDEQ